LQAGSGGFISELFSIAFAATGDQLILPAAMRSFGLGKLSISQPFYPPYCEAVGWAISFDHQFQLDVIAQLLIANCT